MNASIKHLATACLALSLAAPLAADDLRSLKNLERERAVLLSTVVASAESDSSITAQRQRASIQRLVDIERIAIRDEKLSGNRDPMVSKAFSNYDLTFLVHASAEADSTPVLYWLEQIGLSAASINNATVGRR